MAKTLPFNLPDMAVSRGFIKIERVNFERPSVRAPPAGGNLEDKKIPMEGALEMRDEGSQRCNLWIRSLF
jgi:hypothetical protein